MSTFRITSNQFGYPMYAADVSPPWSDRPDEAHVYDERDNPAMKLAYWRADAANRGLAPEAVRVEVCE